MAKRQKKISVIIPYMPIMPYSSQIVRTLDDLDKQTANIEVIVSDMPVESHINKGKLFNKGMEKATGDVIFHCDADIIMKDHTLLERMREKLEDGWEVIYPMFYSPYRRCMKIADGHPFVWREIREEYGDYDEDLYGISLQEFIPLRWYLDKKFYCGPEYRFDINMKPFVKKAGKVHRPTRIKCRAVHDECVEILREMGVWPSK